MSDPEGTYRIYLKKGEKAPRGVEVVTSSRGNRYYLKKRVRVYSRRPSRSKKPPTPREEPAAPEPGTSAAEPQDPAWSADEEPAGGWRDRRAGRRLVRIDALPQIRVGFSPLSDGINPVETLMYLPDILRDLVDEVRALRMAVEMLNKRRGSGGTQ